MLARGLDNDLRNLDDVRREAAGANRIFRDKPKKIRPGEEAIQRAADLIAQPRAGRLEALGDDLWMLSQDPPERRKIAVVNGADGVGE